MAPHEFARAGDEDFDYLLGLSALESGHPSAATIAFERVLATNPNHAAARLDMGRALFALGDFANARIELEAIQHLSPPPAAQATAKRYLDEIAERIRAGSAQYSAYLEASLGHDSNVNYANSSSVLFVPLFATNFVLAPANVRRPDNYGSLGGGLQGSYPVETSVRLLASADLRQRFNFTADSFNFLSGDFRGGAQYVRGTDVFRVILGHNRYELDKAGYRSIDGVTAEWNRRLNERTELSLFIQDSRIRYLQEATRINSGNLALYGVGATRAVGDSGRVLLLTSLFAGDETATDGRLDGDRKLAGMRAGIQAALSTAVDAYASLSIQRSRYERTNPLFLVTRNDFQRDFIAGVSWHFATRWSLRPQLSYTSNSSPVAINKFDRYDVSIALRREFK